MFVVTRADLSAGSQIAQTAHAVSEYALTRTVEAARWREDSNSLVVVAAPGLPELEALAARARDRGLDPVEFREPDMGGELTAVLLPGGSALPGKLVANLPLAGTRLDAASSAAATARERDMRAAANRPDTFQGIHTLAVCVAGKPDG